MINAVSLIATDLDGTLLNPQGRTSTRTRQVLAQVHDRGPLIVAATGRPLRSVLPLLDEGHLPHLDILTVGNGALTVEPHTLRKIEEVFISANRARALVHQLRCAIPELGIAWESGLHLTIDETLKHLLRHRQVVLDTDEADTDEQPDGQVHQILAVHPTLTPAELAPHIETIVGSNAVVTHSGGGLVEIADPHANKATALQRVARRARLNINEAIAFGDGLNDLTMLQAAGWGVAMANADPLVRHHADQLAPSNADDGVAHILETLLTSDRFNRAQR